MVHVTHFLNQRHGFFFASAITEAQEHVTGYCYNIKHNSLLLIDHIWFQITQVLNLFPALMAKIMLKLKFQNTLTIEHLDLEIIAAKHSPPDVTAKHAPGWLKPNF